MLFSWLQQWLGSTKPAPSKDCHSPPQPLGTLGTQQTTSALNIKFHNNTAPNKYGLIPLKWVRIRLPVLVARPAPTLSAAEARAVPQTASLALVPPPTAAPAPTIGPGRADGARTTTGHLESTAVLPLPKAPYVARPSLRRRSKPPRGLPRPPTCSDGARRRLPCQHAVLQCCAGCGGLVARLAWWLRLWLRVVRVFSSVAARL